MAVGTRLDFSYRLKIRSHSMVIGLKQVRVSSGSTQSFYRKSFIVTLQASRSKISTFGKFAKKHFLPYFANVQDCIVRQMPYVYLKTIKSGTIHAGSCIQLFKKFVLNQYPFLVCLAKKESRLKFYRMSFALHSIDIFFFYKHAALCYYLYIRI